MTTVRIRGSDRVIEASEGDNLLHVLQAAGHPISTSCGGRATCGLCRLTIVGGKALLSPLGPEEIQHLGNVARVIGTRLACQSRVCGEGDIEVDVPPVDDVELRKRNKAERLQRQRALQQGQRGRGGPGPERGAPEPGGPLGHNPARPTGASPKVEWRPRKLTGGGGQGQPLKSSPGGGWPGVRTGPLRTPQKRTLPPGCSVVARSWATRCAEGRKKRKSARCKLLFTLP